jgi:GDPmannose 4,6-dehydratase
VPKHALITGVTGQDGYYLSQYLKSLDYTVHGFVRRTSTPHDAPFVDIVHHGSLECYDSIVNAVIASNACEIYHLAAQSFVQESFRDPGTTLNVNVMGTQRLLNAVKLYAPNTKVYLACSSEQFGNTLMPIGGYDENSPMIPRSPYGVSKLAAYHLGCNYREAHNMFVANGILFNHESPRRGKEFVTRKICAHVKKLRNILPYITLSRLELGNLSACRDWGHAKDYVRAMHLMLQHDKPDDFVIATGESYSVEDFCIKAFNYIGKDYRNHIKSNTPDNLRPTEVDRLCGYANKAKEVLGWEPIYNIDALIKDMIDNDY